MAPGDLEIGRVRPGTEHREPGRNGPALDGADQASLADPGLAGDEQQVPTTAGHLAEPPVGQLEEVVATHDDGADEGERALHRPRTIGRRVAAPSCDAAPRRAGRD